MGSPEFKWKHICEVIYNKTTHNTSSTSYYTFISFCVSFLYRLDELKFQVAGLQCMGLHSSAGTEHCSMNTEATGSNPVEAPKNFFWGYFDNCLNCDSLWWSQVQFICIHRVHITSFCGKLHIKPYGISYDLTSPNIFPVRSSGTINLEKNSCNFSNIRRKNSLSKSTWTIKIPLFV